MIYDLTLLHILMSSTKNILVINQYLRFYRTSLQGLCFTGVLRKHDCLYITSITLSKTEAAPCKLLVIPFKYFVFENTCDTKGFDERLPNIPGGKESKCISRNFKALGTSSFSFVVTEL